MRVLVACEFSGIVRDAFAERGCEAWSCDRLPTEREGNHYQGDVRDVLYDGGGLGMIVKGKLREMIDSRNKQIITEYVEQGRSLDDIAERVGLTVHRVRQILQTVGGLETVTKRYNSLPTWGTKEKAEREERERNKAAREFLWKEKRERLKEEYLAGATIVELAASYRCSRQAISAALLQEGVDCKTTSVLRTFLATTKKVVIGGKRNKQNLTHFKNEAAKEVGLRHCSACGEYRKIGEEILARENCCKRCRAKRIGVYVKTPEGREKHNAYQRERLRKQTPEQREKQNERMRKYQAKKREERLKAKKENSGQTSPIDERRDV